MSIQSALYRQISTAASRFQPLIKGVNKAIRPLSGPTNIEKAVLDYWELLPAAIPGLYFMYQMGQQLSRDTFIKPTPIRDASTSIGEGLLTKWIVDNTTRVYPAMGVMWGAYRAGMEDNRVNRVNRREWTDRVDGINRVNRGTRTDRVNRINRVQQVRPASNGGSGNSANESCRPSAGLRLPRMATAGY